MNGISLQEAAHKNIILWNLMRKLNFWKVKIDYDSNRKSFVMSLGKPSDETSGHWCNQFHFGRLKFLDNKGNAHVYMFNENTSYLKQAQNEFSFFPTGFDRTVVLARAELLDHLINGFSFGLKWKHEYLMANMFEEIVQTCINIDLNFNEHDMQMEKSIIDYIEVNEIIRNLRVNKNLDF